MKVHCLFSIAHEFDRFINLQIKKLSVKNDGSLGGDNTGGGQRGVLLLPGAGLPAAGGGGVVLHPRPRPRAHHLLRLSLAGARPGPLTGVRPSGPLAFVRTVSQRGYARSNGLYCMFDSVMIRITPDL